MAYKVFKKGKRYVILNAGYGEYWLVDAKTGLAVNHYWDSTSWARMDLESLEGGGASASDFSHSWANGTDMSEFLPKSVVDMQRRLNRRDGDGTKASRYFTPTAGQLEGSRVTKDHGTFQTIKLADGTYGWRMRDGTVTAGYRSPSGATLAGKKAVEDWSKAKLADLGLDPGQSATDTLMGHYRDRVSAVYSKAVDDMRAKQGRAMERYESKRQEWEARVRAGTATQDDFDGWLRGQALLNGRLLDMTEQLARTLTDADSVAMDVASGYLPSAYAENFNYATYEVENGLGVATSFTLYDASTVARLLAKDRQLLPELGTDPAKDLAWNRRKVTEAVTQGILQGESVPKVAKRLEDVAGMDRRAALRNARTALTGAQNAGRCDAYARAKAMGIDMRQEWQATYDSRTRHTHAVLDGEQVEVGEEFSNGLRYPADPKGPPAEVYNCRCTLVPVLGGLDDGGEWKRDLKVGEESYEQWKARHASAIPKSVEQLREEADALSERVEGLYDRLKEARQNVEHGSWSEERHRERLERYRAEAEGLAWAKDLDEASLYREQRRLYDELDAVSEGMGRASFAEYERILGEQDRLYALIDEIDHKIDAKRDYDRAMWHVNYHEEKLREASEAKAAARADIPELEAKLREAVRDRNRAYGALSDAQPFLPDVREKLGDGYADSMEALLRDAEGRHPEIAAAYRRFSSKLVIIEGEETDGGAFYSSSEKGVHMNAATVARGSDYEMPYEVAFHEFGHAIDNVSAYGYEFSGAMGGLQETIKSDWAAFRDANSTASGDDSARDRELIDMLKAEKGAANGASRNAGSLTYSNVSDIIEGCTGVSYPLGFGHGAAYHERENATAHEFFAEVLDSAMTNEESYAQMARMFPNAVRAVVEVCREICS